MESSSESRVFLSWKFCFIIFLTAWIVVADVSPSFDFYQLFLDISPRSTDRRVILYWTYNSLNHLDLGSLAPSIQGWNRVDISNDWAYLKRAYQAESLVYLRYTNNKDVLVYVSIMQTGSERKLVHGLSYCYELQGYTSISKEIVEIEPSEGLILPINVWFVQRPESEEGWILAFWYIVTYHRNTVDRAYFMQIQAYAPNPAIMEEARQATLEFAQEIILTMLTSLIIDFQT